MTDDRLLEISIVARRLAVSPRTIARMLRDPACPLRGIRVHRRAVRVLASSVADLLRAREIGQEETFGTGADNTATTY